MNALLELTNITFSYPRQVKPLLQSASLALHPGERLGITGDNGSGKSTLFHIATGLLPASSGSIRFEGRLLDGEKAFQKARPRMGYLLQRTEDQLFCPTVLEDVAFGPLNLGASPREARRRAEATLERLGIARLASSAGCNLSGGEQKMAALAAVLSMDPTLLLLDEPGNDLDAGSLKKLVALLHELPIPSIIVSHDLLFLRAVATRTLRLQDGELVSPSSTP